MTEFYLASSDFGSDCEPRMCSVAGLRNGVTPGAQYLLVEVTPPLRESVGEGPIDSITEVLLSLIGDCSVDDIDDAGKNAVMADILICPQYRNGVIDERHCVRLGIGTLHKSYEEALRHTSTIAPLDASIMLVVRDKTETALRALHARLLQDRILAPVSKALSSKALSEIKSDYDDVPFVRERSDQEDCALPIFTTVEHLWEWRPERCLYVFAPGESVLRVANAIPDISRILVNPAGSPRGIILKDGMERILEATSDASYQTWSM